MFYPRNIYYYIMLIHEVWFSVKPLKFAIIQLIRFELNKSIRNVLGAVKFGENACFSKSKHFKDNIINKKSIK